MERLHYDAPACICFCSCTSRMMLHDPGHNQQVHYNLQATSHRLQVKDCKLQATSYCLQASCLGSPPRIMIGCLILASSSLKSQRSFQRVIIANKKIKNIDSHMKWTRWRAKATTGSVSTQLRRIKGGTCRFQVPVRTLPIGFQIQEGKCPVLQL